MTPKMQRSKSAIATQPGTQTFFYLFILFILVIYNSSCYTSRQPAYFKTITKDTTITGFVNSNLETKIRKGDVLSIVVTSLSSTEDALFNNAAASANGASNLAGFTVNKDGTILLHRLGRYNVEGLTRHELSEKLQKELIPYMKEPIVNVSYLNHKITVIGEVVKPGIVQMPDEQISLLEVLVLSGDVTKEANRNRIMVIRDNGTEKKIKYINLEDHSIFNSSWYYAQPNDIVYVLADKENIDKEERRRRLQTTFSLVASAVTFLFLVIDRITR